MESLSVRELKTIFGLSLSATSSSSSSLDVYLFLLMRVLQYQRGELWFRGVHATNTERHTHSYPYIYALSVFIPHDVRFTILTPRYFPRDTQNKIASRASWRCTWMPVLLIIILFICASVRVCVCACVCLCVRLYLCPTMSPLLELVNDLRAFYECFKRMHIECMTSWHGT